MTQSAGNLIIEFSKLWSAPDPARLASYFAENAVYQNLPAEAVEGRGAIEKFIAGILAAFNGIDFQIHRQVSDGTLVMNERTDVMRRKDGGEIALPMMGVFEVVDGKITSWRDYFDSATITSALS
jgi:limonene-1,2-epoxide hydrolase